MCIYIYIDCARFLRFFSRSSPMLILTFIKPLKPIYYFRPTLGVNLFHDETKVPTTGMEMHAPLFYIDGIRLFEGEEPKRRNKPTISNPVAGDKYTYKYRGINLTNIIYYGVAGGSRCRDGESQ